MEDIVCNFWEKPCRFCSNESTFCACTYIQKRDGHYIGVKIGYIKSERGQYCNNGDGCWIKDIKYCPAQWALTSGHDIMLPTQKRKYTKKTPIVEKPKRKYNKKPIENVSTKQKKPTIKNRKYNKKVTSITKGRHK